MITVIFHTMRQITHISLDKLINVESTLHIPGLMSALIANDRVVIEGVRCLAGKATRDHAMRHALHVEKHFWVWARWGATAATLYLKQRTKRSKNFTMRSSILLECSWHDSIGHKNSCVQKDSVCVSTVYWPYCHENLYHFTGSMNWTQTQYEKILNKQHGTKNSLFPFFHLHLKLQCTTLQCKTSPLWTLDDDKFHWLFWHWRWWLI